MSLLLTWCRDNGILIDRRLQLRSSSGELSIYSTAEIEPLTTVVQIPKSAVLSVKSSEITEIQTASFSGREAQFALALALYIELQKGDSSRWYGYLQSLPSHAVDIPLLWPSDDPAASFLRNTEIERKLCAREHAQTLIEDLNTYYHDIVTHIYIAHTGVASIFQDFKTAYSLVSSRAFLVDAYHGLSMVPIADAFNHSQEHHVHLESEYDVCPECGAFQQCPHDSPSTAAEPEETTYFEMVANALILTDEEVFNTYGEDLSNADLLVRYAFMSDVNDNDRVIWDFPERSFPMLDFSALEDLGLVHNDDDPKSHCYINSDGVVSRHLFLRMSGFKDQKELNDIFEHNTLHRVAGSIIDLCRERENKLANTDDMDLDVVSQRVRYSILEILSERSILLSCISQWSDILERS